MRGVPGVGWRHEGGAPCSLVVGYHKNEGAPLVVVGTWGWVGAMRGSRT